MGFLQQMKDMQDTVDAPPGTVDQVVQPQAQAERTAVARQAAAEQAMERAAAAGAPAEGDFAPIAGVSLQRYADVSKGLAAYDYDQSKAVEVAVSKGVSPNDWQAAMDGWNARMHNPAVAQRFNALYTGQPKGGQTPFRLKRTENVDVPAPRP